MAIAYSAALKNTRMSAVLTALDAAVGPCKLVIGTSSLSGATGVLATVPFDDPAGTVSTDTLTFSGLPNSATASASGTAAKAEIRDANDVVIVGGLTVAASAADVIINSVAITSGQTVQINSFTIQHG